MLEQTLIVSNVLLWLVVLVLAITLLALARQVGLLHERSAPLGAMVTDDGPGVGDEAPKFEVLDFFGNPVRIGGLREDGSDILLLFLSPTCPMCNKLLPTARSMARWDHLDVVVISDGEREEHQQFLRQHRLGEIPYVVSAEIGMRHRIGRVPYAVLLDAKGLIRAKGLVSTREHLESLVEAKERNLASIQEYLKSNAESAEAVSASQLK